MVCLRLQEFGAVGVGDAQGVALQVDQLLHAVYAEDAAHAGGALAESVLEPPQLQRRVLPQRPNCRQQAHPLRGLKLLLLLLLVVVVLLLLLLLLVLLLLLLLLLVLLLLLLLVLVLVLLLPLLLLLLLPLLLPIRPTPSSPSRNARKFAGCLSSEKWHSSMTTKIALLLVLMPNTRMMLTCCGWSF